VRTGFVARGITYGVIGALAIAIALGAGTAGVAPDQQGALSLIARTPGGRAALVAICAGLLAYALWKLSQVIGSRGPQGGAGPKLSDRVANLAAGIAYLLFFAVAVAILIGGSGGWSSEPRRATAGVLGWPGGQVIAALAGGGLIVVSLYQLYDGLTGGFARDSNTDQMAARERHAFMWLGRVGLTARALVFAVVGYFLLGAAVEFHPASAVGVDGALARLHREPFGGWILGLVAAGLITFGAYSLLEARHRRL
jgi:TRAP-type C4-dicarboxylate transport system permease small subunit